MNVLQTHLAAVELLHTCCFSLKHAFSVSIYSPRHIVHVSEHPGEEVVPCGDLEGLSSHEQM